MRRSPNRPALPRRIGDDAMAVLQAHDWPEQYPPAAQQHRTPDGLARSDGPDTPITAEDAARPTLATCCPRVSLKNDYHINDAAAAPRRARCSRRIISSRRSIDSAAISRAPPGCRHGALGIAPQVEVARRLTTGVIGSRRAFVVGGQKCWRRLAAIRRHKIRRAFFAVAERCDLIPRAFRAAGMRLSAA